jgi:hypothetical protein
MEHMQNVAREQKKESKKLEKMEKKLGSNGAEMNDKSLHKRQLMRQAQMENLQKLKALQQELKPQDFREGQRRRATVDDNDVPRPGGRFQQVADHFVAVKLVEKHQNLRKMNMNQQPSMPANRHSMGDLRELSQRNLHEIDQEPPAPLMFSATLAAMKLAAATTHYHADGQNRREATGAAAATAATSDDEGVDKSDTGLDISIDDFDTPRNLGSEYHHHSQSLDMNLPRNQADENTVISLERGNVAEKINLQDLVPTHKTGKDEDDSSSNYNIQDLVPTSREGSAWRKISAHDVNSLWLDDPKNNKMNYEGGGDSSDDDEDSQHEMTQDNCEGEDYEEEEHIEILNDVEPQKPFFQYTPLNPLRENSEASFASLQPETDALFNQSNEDLNNNFRRGRYLLENQGKSPSGVTNQTKSTSTLFSSNSSLTGKVLSAACDSSEVSSLHSNPAESGRRKNGRMSRLKHSLVSSFKGSTNLNVETGVDDQLPTSPQAGRFNRKGSSRSVTSAPTEFTPTHNRSNPSSSQSVGTSASSTWRRCLSGLSGSMNKGPSATCAPPMQYVEANGGNNSVDFRQQFKNSGGHLSTSAVSDITTRSSARSLSRNNRSRRSMESLCDECSVSSKFCEYYDDNSHARAMSSAISANSSKSSGTRQNSVPSQYRFPTHEHPLVRICPIELFPNSPGWQCDSCLMETDDMATLAYVSTNKNFIVCRKCFSSLGSRIDSA